MPREEQDILHQNDVEDVIAEEYAVLSDSVLSTTTALAAVANAINTTGKEAGKIVINTTTGKIVWATGPLAADAWKDAAGAVAHSPV